MDVNNRKAKQYTYISPFFQFYLFFLSSLPVNLTLILASPSLLCSVFIKPVKVVLWGYFLFPTSQSEEGEVLNSPSSVQMICRLHWKQKVEPKWLHSGAIFIKFHWGAVLSPLFFSVTFRWAGITHSLQSRSLQTILKQEQASKTNGCYQTYHPASISLMLHRDIFIWF